LQQCRQLGHAILASEADYLHILALGQIQLQVFANKPVSTGSLPGLGWVPGRVRSFRSDERSASLPMPHMGWNDVQPRPGSPLFTGLEADARFYFLHSFFFDCDEPLHTAAVAAYGLDFSCAVSAGNVFGVQFHPEKSHRFGTQLLKNFGEL
jgi:glutamine amidotransferase